MQNLVCLRHPDYNGINAPDLNCKVCCSKFVARIRAEQSMKFEAIQNRLSETFQPLVSSPKPANSPAKVGFDASWV